MFNSSLFEVKIANCNYRMRVVFFFYIFTTLYN